MSNAFERRISFKHTGEWSSSVAKVAQFFREKRDSSLLIQKENEAPFEHTAVATVF